jgi:hypothetical protein
MAVFGLSRLTGSGRFFAIAAVFFEQVYPQENIHAEMDDGGQVSLEGCLSMIRALDQHFSVIP